MVDMFAHTVKWGKRAVDMFPHTDERVLTYYQSTRAMWRVFV